MSNQVIDFNEEVCTVCGDIIKLLDYRGDNSVRSFSLYKTSQIDHNRDEYGNTYG